MGYWKYWLREWWWRIEINYGFKYGSILDDFICPLIACLFFIPGMMTMLVSIALPPLFGIQRGDTAALNEFAVTTFKILSALSFSLVTVLHFAEFMSYRRIGKAKYIMGKLAERHKNKKSFSIKVDYSEPALSFRTMLSGRWDPYYTYEPETKGKRKVEIELIPLPGITTSEDALKRIQELGFRPADARELLPFRRRHRYANHEHAIAFLGAVYMSAGEEGVVAAKGLMSHVVNGLARVPYIPRGYFGKDRPFETTYYRHSSNLPFSIPWDENTRFAVVKV